MSKTSKMLSALLLFALLGLALATPAYAFDGRGGDKIIIPSGQVINDDLYAGANEFVLDGTVNGDTVAFGQIVTVNGTVNGDLITAAQTVVVNGTVKGSVRMAGSVLFVGEKARIEGDIVGAGYSLEVRRGATIGRDAVFATGQTLLGSNIGRNVIAYTGALEIDGDVAGNVTARVGEANENRQGVPPMMLGGQSTVTVPIVKQGLSIDPEAKIGGNLDYTQNSDLVFPAGVVTGSITRAVQPRQTTEPTPEQTANQKVTDWILKTGRSLVTLVLIGLLMLWLFPFFTSSVSNELEKKPGPSLLWGVVAYAGFFFLLLLVVFAMILLAIIFGLLTLGSLSATTVFLGLLSLFGLVLGFVLATSFFSKIIFGMALGKWILSKAGSPIANHRYWPMVIGVAITVAIVALLSFPLIPGALGWLLNLAIILFGLGAIWLWVRDRTSKPASPVVPAAS